MRIIYTLIILVLFSLACSSQNKTIINGKFEDTNKQSYRYSLPYKTIEICYLKPSHSHELCTSIGLLQNNDFAGFEITLTEESLLSDTAYHAIPIWFRVDGIRKSFIVTSFDRKQRSNIKDQFEFEFNTINKNKNNLGNITFIDSKKDYIYFYIKDEKEDFIKNAYLTIDNDFENVKRTYVNGGYTKIETYKLEENSRAKKLNVNIQHQDFISHDTFLDLTVAQEHYILLNKIPYKNDMLKNVKKINRKNISLSILPYKTDTLSDLPFNKLSEPNNAFLLFSQSNMPMVYVDLEDISVKKEKRKFDRYSPWISTGILLLSGIIKAESTRYYNKHLQKGISIEDRDRWLGRARDFDKASQVGFALGFGLTIYSLYVYF